MSMCGKSGYDCFEGLCISKVIFFLLQCGDTFLQFYTDLCVFAINVDKGCWEKLKESSTLGPNEEILARKRDMARVRIVVLTYFSLS